MNTQTFILFNNHLQIISDIRTIIMDKRKVAVYLIACIVTIIGCIFIYKKNNPEVQKKESKDSSTSTAYTVNPMSDEDFKFWEGISTEAPTTTVTSKERPVSYQISLDLIEQKPELPSGCESVALTMVLNYYGFNLDKTTIAKDYLIYSDDNYVMGFVGNPFNSVGGGAYAPAMVNTANRFLIENGSSKQAINISGTKLDELFNYIAGDTPVIVWCTIDLRASEPNGTSMSYGEYTYQWVPIEHCVVLTGYNETDNTVTYYDSLSGIKTCSKEEFNKSYETLWQMAMIIQ